tara:strand:+ start:8378 stop:8596 length:219 start_codon:yes stop_codon:yes gene_type:complete
MYRNVPDVVIAMRNIFNIEPRCPTCSEQIITFEDEEELFDKTFEFDDGDKFKIIALASDGKEGSFIMQRVVE